MDLSMAKANGKARKGHKAISMKGIMHWTKNVGLVYSHGLVEMFTKVNTKMMKEMVTVKCVGQMAASIRANGIEAFSMAKVK
jgi:hypothetical protein